MRSSELSGEKRLILWDIDGTLMYCGADGTIALNDTFEELYGIVSAFQNVKVGRAMDHALVRAIIRQFSLPEGDVLRIKEAYIRNLERVLREDSRKRVLDGVVTILEGIGGCGYGFSGLLTSNFRAGAETKLRSVGLDSYFSFGGFGDGDGEKWDAAKDAIALAEAQFGTTFRPDCIFIVGDGVYDIMTAKRLGIRSVAVGTGWTAPAELKEKEPDFYFENLADTASVLDVLLHQ